MRQVKKMKKNTIQNCDTLGVSVHPVLDVKEKNEDGDYLHELNMAKKIAEAKSKFNLTSYVPASF